MKHLTPARQPATGELSPVESPTVRKTLLHWHSSSQIIMNRYTLFVVAVTATATILLIVILYKAVVIHRYPDHVATRLIQC